MKRLAGWLALAGLSLAAPGHAQSWREVMALGKPDPTVLREGGVEARIDSVTQAAADKPDEEITRARVIVTFPGQDPLELPAADQRNDAYPLSVGVGYLGPGQTDPVVIVEGTSGGAHCCATFQMAAMTDGAIVALGLPPIDGSPGTGFPTDIDGDGAADIRRTDDGILYAFSSYAASVAVPKIYNLRGGKLADVSAEPRFAAVYQALAEEALPLCTDKHASERGGACASYAAAKARLGQAEEGIATAAANAGTPDWLPSSCAAETVDGACPEGQEMKFATFEEALRSMLKTRGYLDPPPPFIAIPPVSEVPVDSAPPVLGEEGVGLAEVPAPQEP